MKYSKKILIMMVASTLLFSLFSACEKKGCAIVGKLSLLDPLMIKPTLYSDLGQGFSVPDGLALDNENNLYLAVPNYLSWEEDGSKIVKIVNGTPVDWCLDLPKHPETGMVHPMGIEFGPDGNLYVADNQYFTDKNYKSRLLRVTVEDGMAISVDVAVEGFKLANAVRWQGDSVYVSDTHFDLADKKHQSGVYRISLDEMNAGLVSLKPNATDEHLIAQFTAKEFGVAADTDGADGVTFDSKGNLYCGNFGDGVISKVSFTEEGVPCCQQIVIDDPSIECCDGIICDTVTDKIYITNSKNNSVHIYDVANHSLQLLWINDDETGENGLLDQPCEPIIKDGQLLVVNFDMSFPGLKNQSNDDFNTISVFSLPQ